MDVQSAMDCWIGWDGRYRAMSSAAAEAYFASEFEKELEAVGREVLEKYSPVIRAYREVIIPFERSRVNEHQSIIFENSSLEQNKIELMGKIEQEKAENNRNELTLELQRKKLNEFERQVEDLEMLNNDHLSLIESLRLRNDDYLEALDHKNESITQLEKDKQVLLEKFQEKDREYHLVLSNFMRDKNELAEKLNNLNEVEQSLLERDKELKAEKFYLQKQWEELEEARDKKPTPHEEEKKKEPRIFKSQFFPTAGESVIEDSRYGQDKKTSSKDVDKEVLRVPMRKLVKHHQSEIYDFSLNYNGNFLASCGGDRFIKVFDVMNMRTAASISSNSAESVFICVSLDYSGDRLLSGSTDKTVNVYHSHTGKHLHSFLGHGSKVNSVCWTSSKERCASGSDDKQLKVWDIEKASNIFSVGCQKSVKVVRSNNVEPVVFTGHVDGSVRVYSVSQGNSPVSQVKGLIDYSITSLTLLSNRHQVLVTSLEGSVVQLVDLKMNKSIGKYEHKDFFNSAAQGAVSPSESLVLAGNCDGAIYYWNRFKGDMVKKVTGHDGAVTALSYHFMSSTLASGDKEGSMILWQ